MDNQLDQQIKSSTNSSKKASTPIIAPETEAFPDASNESLKVTVRLFSCDGCGRSGRSYPTSMILKMHKKISCKARSNQNIKTESEAKQIKEIIENIEAGEATLEEGVQRNVETKEKNC